MTDTKRGRPARSDEPERLVVHIPGDLKKWLRVYAVLAGTDMGTIVSEALTIYRKNTKVYRAARRVAESVVRERRVRS